MPVKAPAARTYNWGGCYIGVNGGGAASGSDFTTTVGTGTHLTTADAALVVEGGTSSANSPNFLGGGQAGCNWVSGTFVYGLEGDVDYFRSNPQIINGTATLSDGVTQLHRRAVAHDQLPGDGASAPRGRCGSQPVLRHRRRGLHQGELYADLL